MILGFQSKWKQQKTARESYFVQWLRFGRSTQKRLILFFFRFSFTFSIEFCIEIQLCTHSMCWWRDSTRQLFALHQCDIVNTKFIFHFHYFSVFMPRCELSDKTFSSKHFRRIHIQLASSIAFYSQKRKSNECCFQVSFSIYRENLFFSRIFCLFYFTKVKNTTNKKTPCASKMMWCSNTQIWNHRGNKNRRLETMMFGNEQCTYA